MAGEAGIPGLRAETRLPPGLGPWHLGTDPLKPSSRLSPLSLSLRGRAGVPGACCDPPQTCSQPSESRPTGKWPEQPVPSSSGLRARELQRAAARWGLPGCTPAGPTGPRTSPCWWPSARGGGLVSMGSCRGSPQSAPSWLARWAVAPSSLGSRGNPSAGGPLGPGSQEPSQPLLPDSPGPSLPARLWGRRPALPSGSQARWGRRDQRGPQASVQDSF